MGIAEFKLRWKALIHRRAFEREVEDELAFHSAMRERKFVEEGSDPMEARDAARRRFGNSTVIGETMREMRSWGILERLWQDLRFALRLLRIHRGFTLGAVIPLALAIGCTTAVFTLVDAVLFRSTGIKNPGQVAAIYTFSRANGRYLSDSYPDFRDIRSLDTLVDSAAAYMRSPMSVRVAETAEQLNVELVSGDYFRASGVVPVFGRALGPGDDRPGAAPVALVSDALWESRYGRSPSLLGSTIWINRSPFTVVGVMPRGYRGMLLDWNGDLSVWTPVENFNRLFPGNGAVDYQNRREIQMFMIMARLRPGASLARLQAALDVLATRAAARPEYRFLALPAAQARFFPAYRAATLRFLWLLLGVCAAALAIACCNLANLLLARAAARQREIRTRLAVGAGRWRLLQQFLVENAVLASCACALSLPLAIGATAWLGTAHITNGFNLALDLTTDGRTLLLGIIAGVATAFVTGIAPALKTLRPGRQGERPLPWGEFFVAAQVACAMVVLASATLLGRSLRHLENTHLGYDARGILLGSLDTASGGKFSPDDNDAISRRLLDQIRSQANGAALAWLALPTQIRSTFDVRPDAAAGSGWVPVSFNWISDGYFELLRMPLLSGRGIEAQDNRRGRRIAVINQSAAARLWPGENPIGRRLRIRQEPEDREVVGVVRDARYRTLAEVTAAVPPYVFLPLFQKTSPGGFIVHVRTQGDPLLFAGPLRRIVSNIVSDAPLYGVQTLQEHVEEGSGPIRSAAQAAEAVSGLGIVLAVAGIFASGAYRVAQRRKEIAVRIAIGAKPARVIRTFAARGLWIGLAGASLGLAPAFWASGLLRASVPGVDAAGFPVFGIAAAALILVAGAAAFVAARRIARIDPADVLRVQ